MSRKGVVFLGGAVGAGAFYYLYNAGGDAKVAEKQFEHDAARVSSTIKNELPGKGRELKTQAKVYGEQAGSKIDQYAAEAKSKLDRFDNKVYETADDVKRRLQQEQQHLRGAIDQFDRKATNAASDLQRGASNTLSEAERQAIAAKDRALQGIEGGARKLESEAQAKQSNSGWFGGLFGGK